MISIAPYLITINKERVEVPLNEPFGDGSFLEFAEKWLKQLSEANAEPDKPHLGHCELTAQDGDSALHGVVEVGEYGYSSRLFDTQQQLTSHRRSVVEAELLPFCVYFFCPPGEKRGLLALQRFKLFGIRKLVFDQMRLYFQQQHPTYKMNIRRLAHDAVAQQLFDGSVLKEYRLQQFTRKTDIADELGIDPGIDHYCEVVVKAGRDEVFPKLTKIREVLGRRRNVRGLFVINGWDFDAVKLIVEQNGKRRTIDLGNLGRVAPNIDISEDVEKNKNGHPDPASYNIIARQVLEEFWQQLPVN